MSAEHEAGGTEATEAEAAAVLAVLFAERTGDAVRALRTYAATLSGAHVDALRLMRRLRPFINHLSGDGYAVLVKLDAALAALSGGAHVDGPKAQKEEVK